MVVVLSELGLSVDNKPLNLHRHLLSDLTKPLRPLKVTGDIEYMFNRTKDGWLVTLVNNRGVYKKPSSPLEVRSTEAAEVVIDFPSRPSAVSEIYRQRDLPKLRSEGENHSLNLVIPPGEIFVLKIQGQ
jgi:hypothetical protein